VPFVEIVPKNTKKVFLGKLLPADSDYVPEAFFIGPKRVAQSKCKGKEYLGCVRVEGTLNHYYK